MAAEVTEICNSLKEEKVITTKDMLELSEVSFCPYRFKALFALAFASGT